MVSVLVSLSVLVCFVGLIISRVWVASRAGVGSRVSRLTVYDGAWTRRPSTACAVCPHMAARCRPPVFIVSLLSSSAVHVLARPFSLVTTFLLFFALSLLLPIHYSRFSIFIFLLRCGLSRARSIVDMTIPICPVIGSTPPSHAACAQQLGYFKLLRHMHRALLPPSSPFPLCARRRRRRCSLALHVILVFTTLTLLFTNGGTVRVFACVLDWLLRTQPVADTYM